MKKLLYTIACSLIAINGFSQKKFSQIEFTKVKTTSGHSSVLDMGIYANKNATNHITVDVIEKPGTININTKDSIVTVKIDGTEDKVYKITYITEEKVDKKYKSKNLDIWCKSKNGNDVKLNIYRREYGKKDYGMDVSITSTNGDGDEYTCIYIKDLF